MSGKRAAFQGEPGAYSHLACQSFFPDAEPVAHPTFEDAFAAVASGDCAFGLIPIENTLAGRVADFHHLIPETGLRIVGERFLPIRHQLLCRADADFSTIKTAHSHAMALGQCRKAIRELGLAPVAEADTAGAARKLAESGDASQAAIASSLAAEIYGLKILRPDIEDAHYNVTRFVMMAPEQSWPKPDDGPVVTSFIFRVRNIPAALYKAMGGFATNGVNMTKLESYQIQGAFNATQFYAEIEGHPENHLEKLAFAELAYFTSRFEILGVYSADPFRKEAAEKAAAAKLDAQT